MNRVSNESRGSQGEAVIRMGMASHGRAHSRQSAAPATAYYVGGGPVRFLDTMPVLPNEVPWMRFAIPEKIRQVIGTDRIAMRSMLHAWSNLQSGPNRLDRRDWGAHERDAIYAKTLEATLHDATGWRLRLKDGPSCEVRWAFYAPVPEPGRTLMCVVGKGIATGDVFLITFFTMNERAYGKTQRKGGIVRM